MFAVMCKININTLLVGVGLALFINSCGLITPKETTDAVTGSETVLTDFDLKTAMQKEDTAAVRKMLTGSWTLDKICRSTFIGLKCDSSLRQRWVLDSSSAIRWRTKGGLTTADHYYFIPRGGANTTKPPHDSVWVMQLQDLNKGYLIKTLTSHQLVLTEFPLIMDNTITYYLSR